MPHDRPGRRDAQPENLRVQAQKTTGCLEPNSCSCAIRETRREIALVGGITTKQIRYRALIDVRFVSKILAPDG